MITGIIIIVVVVVVLIFVMVNYNGFVRLRNNVEEAFSTMDVYMKKRYDLIPNLVETVKGYAKHEKETLTAVINARNAIKAAGNDTERLAAENQLTQTLGHLFAIAEAYPDLKANQNFLDLQSQLTKIEDDIANSRKYYNGCVKQYNTKREMFPSNIIANLFHFEKKPLFEINETERQNVNVSFE
jgi:LemA protein